MKLPSFNEYLNAQKTLVTKPKVEKVSDYPGPKETKPAKAATRGKNWEVAVKPDGQPAPYTTPTTPVKGKPGFDAAGCRPPTARRC